MSCYNPPSYGRKETKNITTVGEGEKTLTAQNTETEIKEMKRIIREYLEGEKKNQPKCNSNCFKSRACPVLTETTKCAAILPLW